MEGRIVSINGKEQTPSRRGRPSGLRLTDLWRSRSAVAAIEFAFLMPIFLVLFVGIIDVGMMLVQDYKLDQAVAAGQEYAAINAASVTAANGATLASNIATTVESAKRERLGE